MSQLSAYIDWNTLMFVVIGFGAQLCDGALGMGFGVISSTVLTLIGLPRMVVTRRAQLAQAPLDVRIVKRFQCCSRRHDQFE